MSDNSDEIEDILADIGLVDEETSVEGESPDTGDNTGDNDEDQDRLAQLHDAGLLTDEEYDLLRSHHSDAGLESDDEDDSQGADVTEFGTVPATETIDGYELSVLGVFPDADIAPLMFDHKLDNEQFHRTVVLWEVYNKTDLVTEWGNTAVDYVLDNRMKANPDSGPVLDIERLSGQWEHCPQSGVIAEVGANTRARWFGLVEVPESQQIVEAHIESRGHPRTKIEIPRETVGDPDELPF